MRIAPAPLPTKGSAAGSEKRPTLRGRVARGSPIGIGKRRRVGKLTVYGDYKVPEKHNVRFQLILCPNLTLTKMMDSVSPSFYALQKGLKRRIAVSQIKRNQFAELRVLRIYDFLSIASSNRQLFVCNIVVVIHGDE